jgi:hypothetical protein
MQYGAKEQAEVTLWLDNLISNEKNILKVRGRKK